MSGPILWLTDDNVEDAVMRCAKPVCIDFKSPWCTQCQTLEPVFVEMAARYGDRMAFAFCDISAHASVAARFGVMSVPTIVLVRDGHSVESLSGRITRERVVALIEDALA